MSPAPQRASGGSRLSYLAGARARLLFWGGAVLVGLSAVLFTRMTDWALRQHAQLIAAWPHLGLLVTPIGLAAAALLTRRFVPGAEGSGIPQVVAALHLTETENRPLLSAKVAVAKVGLASLGLLSGGSIGREGPTVHIGAALMDALGRLAGVPFQSIQRALILAGGAAGIAAAFNTPIAGIVFAVEELGRTFEERNTGTLLTAVVIAGVISTALLGNYVYFGEAAAHLPSAASWIAVPLCGISGGLLGGLFSLLLIQSGRRIAPVVRARPVTTIFAIGCAVALIGWLSNGMTFGTGYSQARALLVEQHAPPNLLFPLYKLAATLLSYATGVPGGIFSPSLSTGAGLGADLGLLFPNVPMAAMIILGMAGYFTGVTQTPMTASIIVMEMVDDHALILPMLATTFLAMVTSRVICPKPVYQALAEPFVERSRAAAGGTAAAPAPMPDGEG